MRAPPSAGRPFVERQQGPVERADLEWVGDSEGARCGEQDLLPLPPRGVQRVQGREVVGRVLAELAESVGEHGRGRRREPRHDLVTVEMGSAIGLAAARANHQVVFGSRSPDDASTPSAWSNLLEPVFPDEPADMFYTAMETHRPAVEGLIKALGLRPIHLSPDAHQVATLWFTLALGQERGRHVAFRVLQ